MYYGYGYGFNHKGDGAAQLLVDLYTPIAAYSLRKLSSTATNAIRVRRSSDNAEQNIGFVGNDLDTASISSFCSGTTGYITKVYNQGAGGAAYDAAQGTASDQPIIYKSGAVFSVNGLSAIDFERSGIASSCKPMDIASSISPLTTFAVSKVDVQNTVNYLLGNDSPAQGLFTNGTFFAAGMFGGINSNAAFNTTGNTSQHLGYWNNKSSKLYVARNGATESDLGAYVTGNTITMLGGRAVSPVIYLRGSIQEVIMFTSDQTSNKTAIETNINTYYGIY